MKKILSLSLIAIVAACAIVISGFTHDYVAVQASAKAPDLNITSKSAFLIEANSGKVLFSKDADKRLPIASMVKIMTLAVIYDALEAGELTMGDMVTVSRNASGMGGSQAFLDFDSQYAVEELVKTIIVASANDSCVALAEHIAGSEAEFVARMNALAAELGMTNSNFANPTGLPAPNSYSTAADIAKAYAYIIKSPFYNYVRSGDAEPMHKSWMYDLAHPSGRITGLTNTNRHARFFNGCTGGKTGFTAEAGHCITVTAERNNIRPVAVIIGATDSQTRFAESGNLLNFALSSFENRLIVDASSVLGSINLRNAMQDAINVYAKENFFDLVKKGEKDAEPTVTIEINRSVKAPITADTVLGTIVITDDGVVVKEIDVVAGVAINELKYFDALRKISQRYKL